MKHIKTAMATEGSPLYAPELAAIAKQDLLLIIIVSFLNFQIGSQMFVVIWILELLYCTSKKNVNVEGVNFATQTHHVRKARRRERLRTMMMRTTMRMRSHKGRSLN